MKKYTVALLALLLVSFVQLDAFKQLSGLKGVWKMQTKRGGLYEEWSIVDDKYLQSRGYFVKGTDTVVNERVALQHKADGIYYTSTVENQNNRQPVAFKLTAAANNTFVFENPEHDFPKRIVYRLINKDSIHAFIDDGIDSSKKRSNFYYKRIH